MNLYEILEALNLWLKETHPEHTMIARPSTGIDGFICTITNKMNTSSFWLQQDCIKLLSRCDEEVDLYEVKQVRIWLYDPECFTKLSKWFQ